MKKTARIQLKVKGNARCREGTYVRGRKSNKIGLLMSSKGPLSFRLLEDVKRVMKIATVLFISEQRPT